MHFADFSKAQDGSLSEIRIEGAGLREYLIGVLETLREILRTVWSGRDSARNTYALEYGRPSSPLEQLENWDSVVRRSMMVRSLPCVGKPFNLLGFSLVVCIQLPLPKCHTLPPPIYHMAISVCG